MKKLTGLYPAFQVDAAACGVVSQAGGVVLLKAAPVSEAHVLRPDDSTTPARGPDAT